MGAPEGQEQNITIHFVSSISWLGTRTYEAMVFGPCTVVYRDVVVEAPAGLSRSDVAAGMWRRGGAPIQERPESAQDSEHLHRFLYVPSE